MSGPKLVALAALVMMTMGCEDTTVPAQGQPCIEGRTRACRCLDMTQGYQSCRFDGLWSLCICGAGSAGTSALPDASIPNR